MFRRVVLPILRALFTLGAVVTACAPSPLASPAAPQAEILWDRWGVPHIYATDAESAFHAFGWSQAHSHGDLLLALYGQARGRAAEYWGEAQLESDSLIRTLDMPARARRWYDGQPAEFRRALDAFAAGINAYAAAHPERIVDSVHVVLPVSGADILAHGHRVLHGVFLAGPDLLGATMRRWRGGASNAWAVAPRRTVAGNALLLANPHLPWSDLFLWYEAHITLPGMNVYGATLVGMPVIAIGFNDRLAWTHTVNTIDASDLFELRLAQDGYAWDGGTRQFEVRAETLLVRRNGRSSERRVIDVLSSVHGPVVARRNGRALALRTAGLESGGAFSQWWDMARARNLEEFERALARVQIPMFTVIYADADGRIMHLFNGDVPVRPRGDWGFWSRIVPGDTSGLLWTRTHAYEELPRLVDPATGWLQNANDPPWTTTVPVELDPDRYPPYMAPRGMSFRAQRSARLMMESERLTLEEMAARKHDTGVELATRLLDDLVPAARASDDELLVRAGEVLARWDRRTDATSRGAVLFEALVRRLSSPTGPALFAERWRMDDPVRTPRALRDTSGALSALAGAAQAVLAEHGALDVEWGRVRRLRRDGVDLPASGGPGWLGIFRVVDFDPDGNGTASAVGGDSFVAVIELSDPPRALALLGYGNASQPGSPHRTDQMSLMSRQQLRPAWRSRGEVEANLSRREVVLPR